MAFILFCMIFLFTRDRIAPSRGSENLKQVKDRSCKIKSKRSSSAEAKKKEIGRFKRRCKPRNIIEAFVKFTVKFTVLNLDSERY